MRHQFQIPFTTILLVLLPLIAFSGAKQTPSESYYERLKSLVSPFPNYPIHPNATGRDVNVIEVEKGAAGVVFGASIDDVVAVWGKPESIMVNKFDRGWFLGIGGCEFGFVDNRLTAITVSRITVETAHLANGLTFDSSYDEVKSAFGEPVEATDLVLSFVTENGYTTEFCFYVSPVRNKRELIAINISSPDSGRSMRTRPGRPRTAR